MVRFFFGFSAFLDFVSYQISFGSKHAEPVRIVYDAYDSDLAFVLDKPALISLESREVYRSADDFHDWLPGCPAEKMSAPSLSYNSQILRDYATRARREDD